MPAAAGRPWLHTQQVGFAQGLLLGDSVLFGQELGQVDARCLSILLGRSVSGGPPRSCREQGWQGHLLAV